MTDQFLSFALGGELYGVDILRVQEIRGWVPVRTLPDVPAYIKGVLDLRGIVVPIVDLRVRFGLPDPEYSPTTVVVIQSVYDSTTEMRTVGAVVDAVSDVLDVTITDVKPTTSLGHYLGAGYLSGMVTIDEQVVVLLDIDKLFSDAELFKLTTTVEAVGGH